MSLLTRLWNYLFKSKTDEEAKRGDLIEIFRGGYQHWAVYVGGGFVVHVTSASDVPVSSAHYLRSVPNKKALVKKEKLKDVVGNNKWEINNSLDEKVKPRSPDLIVKEADAAVGKEMAYNLLMENCEHFANKLRYGKPESRQVQQKAWEAATMVMQGAALIALLGIVLSIWMLAGARLESR